MSTNRNRLNRRELVRRGFGAVCGAGLVAAALVGCGQPQPSPEPPPNTPPGGGNVDAYRQRMQYNARNPGGMPQGGGVPPRSAMPGR